MNFEGYINGELFKIIHIENNGTSYWTTYIDDSGNIRLEKGFNGVDITSATIPPTSGNITSATPSLWYGANWELLTDNLTSVRSYQHQILNNTGKTWLSIRPLFASYGTNPGVCLGWRVRPNNSAIWTNGTFNNGLSEYTPPSATNSYDAVPYFADVADLAIPVLNGQSIWIEVVRAAGDHVSGKVSTGSLPSTCLAGRRSNGGQNSISGDTMTWVPGYGAPWTHLYIGTDPSQGGIRKVGFTGDSLTAQVKPLADSNNTRRQGYAVVASLSAATNNESFQLISFGRGTYTLAQMQTSQVNLSNLLSSDHLDWMIAQGWSYNNSPLNQNDVNAAIASTSATLSAWSNKGVRTGVNFMSPPGSSRNSESYLPWYDATKSYWVSAIPSKVIDLAPYVWDPVDNTIILSEYSQDGIHINEVGASPHGAGAYTLVKNMLQTFQEI